MKAKIILGAVLVVMAVAATLRLALRPEQPIQVLGGLSKREVADIRAALWRKTHPPILPDFSMQSFRAAPGLLVQRFGRSNPSIVKMEQRNQAFVAVFGRSADDAKHHRYAFWCVFRDKNGWLAETEYHLSDQ